MWGLETSSSGVWLDGSFAYVLRVLCTFNAQEQDLFKSGLEGDWKGYQLFSTANRLEGRKQRKWFHFEGFTQQGFGWCTATNRGL